MRFVIFALPRCRTHWLQTFLSYGGWHVGHDEIRHFRTLADVNSWFAQELVGTVETAAAAFWRLVPEGVRLAVVRRPVDDVVRSIVNTGIPFDPEAGAATMRRMDRKLVQLSKRLPNVLVMDFADLATEAGCATMFEHCLGMPHDHAWWERLAPVNIQEHLSVPMRYVMAYRRQMDRMAILASHRILQNMRVKEREHDGFSFQCESFREFRTKEAQLITDHSAEAERGAWLDFNVPLFEALDDVGALQTMTARSNGRCFGYLVSLVSPSLEGPGVVQGTHTMFYTAPDVRGLGVRLLMKANDALRERGVHEIIMRAGVAGSGPRLGAVYRRLGAKPFGEMYRLEV